MEQDIPNTGRDRATEGLNSDIEWLDVSGLLCDKKRIDGLIDNLTRDKINSLEDLLLEFNKIYNAYNEDVYKWVHQVYENLYDTKIWETKKEALIKLLEKWKEDSLKLLNMVANDAGKEFAENSKTGYGIDGNKDEDFLAVRGTLEEDAFIGKLSQQRREIEEKYNTIKKLMEKKEK